MACHIRYQENPSGDEVFALTRGIMANAKQKKNLDFHGFFGYFLYDEHETMVGGCNGCIFYGCLYLDQLWIDERFRGQGYGAQLMQRVEEKARESHCLFMAVNTFDFEALGFYQKLGFEVEFQRHGFLKDSILYLLKKPLP